MKFRTTAIALAVAGTVATPMAAQADLYASARIGVSNVDTKDVSEITVGGVASRFGIRSETDLGNGMTGFGRYEWGVSTEGSGVLSRRHAYVGLKGDFGSVLVGQTYHTFYNHVVGPLDIPWVGSGFTQVAYTGRTSEALTYAGSSGAISFGATLYLKDDFEKESPGSAPDLTTTPIDPGTAATSESGDEGLDGVELGATIGIGDMSLGLGYQDFEAEENEVIAATLHSIGLGDATLGIGFMMQDDDTSITAEVDIGNIYIHYEMLDCDKDTENSNCSGSSSASGAPDTSPSIITVGYNQSLGRNTMMWYEVHSIDADSGDSDDDLTGVYATLKYDIE